MTRCAAANGVALAAGRKPARRASQQQQQRHAGGMATVAAP